MIFGDTSLLDNTCLNDRQRLRVSTQRHQTNSEQTTASRAPLQQSARRAVVLNPLSRRRIDVSSDRQQVPDLCRFALGGSVATSVIPDTSKRQEPE
jgi:hypothetical protein